MTEIPRSWAASRLAPQGGTARLTLFVSEASLTAVPLERTGGFSGLITFEDAERFEARIVATLTFQDAEGSASASAEVRLSASVPEHTSNARRQAIYEDLMARTEAAFDAELTRQVRTHFPYRAFAGG
ncbi:MAG: hypothetical protein HXY25_08260 [Alphaproteobacteria bacterium]|nr:hypothetical protein [Alphaproteobacteria bacterium]